MLKTIMTKTLYERRWSTFFWALGVVAMALLMMAFFHSFKDGGFDQVLQNLPKSFQSLVGNAASYKTVPGYVAQQVFALRVPLVTLVMGITLFTSLVAGDEEKGTLQTLLAQPVSRFRLFAEKYFAGMLISFIVCAGAIAGVLIGLLIIHEHIGFGQLLGATIDVWLLTLLFGTIGFAIGAITGKRGVAGGLAGLFAFGSYLITSFAASVSGLSTVEKFSPFHYYNHPATAQYGLNTHNVIVMLVTIAILIISSLVIFLRRDIYQR